MEEIVVRTKKKEEVLDITPYVEEVLKGYKKEEYKLCHLFLTHTTASLGFADLDPGTDLDMLDAFRLMVPKLNYRHLHNPSHVVDHILSTLLGVSILVPLKSGNLILGTWQRIVLFEFDGPRERKIILTLIK